MDNPINGETADTLQASPAEQQTPEVTENENAVVASQPPQTQTATEEEAAWNSLKGSTQDRIKAILHERDELRNKVSVQTPVQMAVQQPTYAPTQASDDEVMQAANILKSKAGFVTQDQLDALSWTLDKEKRHERLGEKYSGTNGLPKYDRQEVEDHMNRTKIWDPEAAFQNMYFDEFVDNRKTQKKQVYTEKPQAPSGRDETLTVESLRAQLSGPDKMKVYEKYAKNPEQFDALLKQLTQE